MIQPLCCVPNAPDLSEPNTCVITHRVEETKSTFCDVFSMPLPIFFPAAESERSSKPPVAFATSTSLRLTKQRDRPSQAHARTGPRERQRGLRPMKTHTPARKTPPASSSTCDATRRRLIPAMGKAPCGPVSQIGHEVHGLRTPPPAISRVGLNKCGFTPYDIFGFFWAPR